MRGKRGQKRQVMVFVEESANVRMVWVMSAMTMVMAKGDGQKKALDRLLPTREADSVQSDSRD